MTDDALWPRARINEKIANNSEMALAGRTLVNELSMWKVKKRIEYAFACVNVLLWNDDPFPRRTTVVCGG